MSLLFVDALSSEAFCVPPGQALVDESCAMDVVGDIKVITAGAV